MGDLVSAGPPLEGVHVVELAGGIAGPFAGQLGDRLGPRPMVVLGAPVLEEAAFRGWLSGRPGHLLAYAALGAGL